MRLTKLQSQHAALALHHAPGWQANQRCESAVDRIILVDASLHPVRVGTVAGGSACAIKRLSGVSISVYESDATAGQVFEDGLKLGESIVPLGKRGFQIGISRICLPVGRIGEPDHGCLKVKGKFAEVHKFAVAHAGVASANRQERWTSD